MNFIMSSIYDTKTNLFYIKSAETLEETRGARRGCVRQAGRTSADSGGRAAADSGRKERQRTAAGKSGSGQRKESGGSDRGRVR